MTRLDDAFSMTAAAAGASAAGELDLVKRYGVLANPQKSIRGSSLSPRECTLLNGTKGIGSDWLEREEPVVSIFRLSRAYNPFSLMFNMNPIYLPGRHIENVIVP
jgi:hypothetical protein